MTCQHQIALCKLHNCHACDHHGDESICPFAQYESAEACAPTFRQMFDVYKHSKASQRHIASVIQTVKADLKRIGLSEDSKCIEMTRTRFKTLIERLTSPMPDGAKLRGNTIMTHLTNFKALASDRFEDRYNDLGFELPAFSIPKFKADKVPIQEISDRTIRKVEIEMEKWLASGKPSDSEAYKLCFFALYCGMRAGDICEAKWSIIRQTTAGVMIAYKPHKTLYSTGVTVSFPISNKTYCKIEPLIGSDNEFVLTRHPERIGLKTRKDGRFDGMHVYLRSKVNKMLSACGIGNDYRMQKKTHALRKYYETDRVFTVGQRQAALECGHTVEVQRRSYLGTMAGKIL